MPLDQCEPRSISSMIACSLGRHSLQCASLVWFCSTAAEFLRQKSFMAATSYNRYWTCSKQEPGTENIDMYPEKQSSNANQKRLPPLNGLVPRGVPCPCQTVWCLACSEELFKLIMWMWQIASCLVSTSPLASSPECGKHLAEALHSLQSGGRQTFLSCYACDLLLKLARPPSSGIGLASNKSLALKISLCIPKKQSPNANQKRLVCYLPLMVLFPRGVPCPCQTVWCLACSEELFKLIMWMWQIASCLVSTSPLASSPECGKHLAEALHSLQSGGRQTFLSCYACDLLLKLTRPPSSNFWTSIKQEPSTENIVMYREKSSLQMRTKKGYLATYP